MNFIWLFLFKMSKDYKKMKFKIKQDKNILIYDSNHFIGHFLKVDLFHN